MIEFATELPEIVVNVPVESRDHWESQSQGYSLLHKAGAKKVKWNSGSAGPDGLFQRYVCQCEDSVLTFLALHGCTVKTNLTEHAIATGTEKLKRLLKEAAFTDREIKMLDLEDLVDRFG